jgi:carbamoyl-phosphate synthase large subunit
MKKINILVTGCGDDIGQSIGKILKTLPFSGNIVGTDISLNNASKFIYDKLIQVPPINSLNYSNEIHKIIDSFNIDVIIPSCEPEIRYHTKKNIDKTYLGKIFISSDLNSRKIGFDKLKTVNFLKKNNFPFPETNIVGKIIKPKFPLIIKSRAGSGSKKIFIVNNKNDFNFYKNKYSSFIAQELINDSEAEYTCGLFRSKNNDIRYISYERLLLNGYSSYGRVVDIQEVNELLMNLAIKINLIGAINVQFKISKRGPCIFEINPRFSSTVRFRDLMGFKDLLWSLEDSLDLPISDYQKVKKGTAFYKGFEEFIGESEKNSF